MNAPIASTNPGLQALAEVFEQMLERNNVNLTNAIGTLCERFAAAAGNQSTAHAMAGKAGASCKLGGNCKGTCTDCSGHTHALLGTQGDAWTGLVQTMQQRGCGLMCRPLNPCFLWALQVMLTRVSLRRLYWMLEKDDDSAEINVNAGDPTDFVNILTTPLALNQKALLVMSGAQMLPIMPVLSKATATWVGDPVITGVKISLFQGPKNLGLLTLDQVTAQLMPLGQAKTLSKWFCTAPNGVDGTCFLRPWPPFLGCSGGVIPDTEAIYMMIETDGTLGASTLKALVLEVIKAGTYDGQRLCKTCDIKVDEYGYPNMIPPQLL